jgi:hypothetical protein
MSEMSRVDRVDRHKTKRKEYFHARYLWRRNYWRRAMNAWGNGVPLHIALEFAK